MRAIITRNARNAIAALVAAVATCLLVGSAHAQFNENASAETRFLAAREAARTGNRAELERIAYQITGHPLDSYIRYWLLSNKLARSEMLVEDGLRQFFADEPGSLLAERLRVDWLRRLARSGDWPYFLMIYSELQNPDDELRCYAWSARLMTGDRTVLSDIANAWPSLTYAHGACGPALRAAVEQRAVSTEDIWYLFRRRVDTRTPARARTVLAWLAEDSLKSFDQSMSNPRRYLDRLPPKTNSRGGREVIIAALTRIAREDVAAAHSRFQRLQNRLTVDDRAYVWGMLACHAAKDHRHVASAWFRNAGDVQLNALQRIWRVRAALRDGDWHAVLAAINGLSAEERTLPEWVYWRGRALKAMQRTDEADKAFSAIASVPNFYGILANEELGKLFDPRAAHTALAVTTVAESDDSAPDAGENTTENNSIKAAEAEVFPQTSATATSVSGPSVDKHPGFQRALALFRLDLRIEAVREWNWALRGRDTAFRLAAAQLAVNNYLYDRAITSAELANPAGAWELRFLTPYRELIEPHANSKNLDLSWVYGVMRQESRFIIPSRSPTGAQGLMQVMPATGKWVAEKLGLYYHPGLLRDPDTNVELGTEYMRIILGELEGDQVLAAAGYNAGPGRARRWRAGQPLEGAVYAETIPFDETRDYVKHVMTNAVIYAALFEGRPQSLKARLGTIQPRIISVR